jgi:hypothetical protein
MNKMIPFDNTSNTTCCKRIQIKDWLNRHTYVCKKPATHTNGSHYFCRQHSGVGRYVARIGDVGDIVARFDTEQELRDNIHLYPNCKMQKLSTSHRRDIY